MFYLGCPKTFSPITKKLSSAPKEAAIATFMVANAFVWYLSGLNYLQDMSPGNLLLIGANLASLIVSALVVISLTNKLKNRLKILKIWVAAGVLLSLLFSLVTTGVFFSLLFLNVVLGVYFGIGMPLCMGYYANSTVPQNRAKLSSIIILLIGVGVPLITVLGQDDALFFVGAQMVWRLVALLLLLPLKGIGESVVRETVTFRRVLGNKTFLLYVFPWLMFSLINDLTREANIAYFETSVVGSDFMNIEMVIAGVSAVLCGIYADKKGRKRLALAGFSLLGLGYASLGLFSGNLDAKPFADWFYVVVDGVAWGAFAMLFLVTIWGDIAPNNNSEKYYFLGVLPYLISNLAGVWGGQFIIEKVEPGTVFSFASIFLFIAVLPLVYAPETLADKLLKNLDLNSYVNKAMEKAKKQQRKGQKHVQSREGTDNDSIADKEAQALAEKYY